MTVYVTENRPCKFQRWKKYAYLLADTEEEIHEFAASIGLKRQWFQGPPKHKNFHYDLFGSMIQKARDAGATQITIRDYIRMKKH